MIPRATYRVQLHAGFTLADAERIVPYLARLGVSHLYASPIFHAAAGSTHGYDVIDYSAINPELGGREALDALVRTLRRHDMGLLLDFVPNHMGIAGGANPWWQDVLEHGPASPYAAYFDIDWQPLKPELQNQVLLPVLGDYYGAVLERGELSLELRDGAFSLRYYELPLPISPRTYPALLRPVLVHVAPEFDPDALPLLELQSLISAFERLPAAVDPDPARADERRRESIVSKHRLALLTADQPVIAAAIEAEMERFNGTPGIPASFDDLDRLIELQVYRLAYWRVAAEEINYRRFFAINELGAIRQEERDVFAATHATLLDLIANGSVDGVRIDHPDGLWDPAGYFRDLQRAAFVARCRSHGDIAGREADLEQWWDARTGSGEIDPRGLYLVIEKILEHGEELPTRWPVHGTVGYEFATDVSQLLVDSANRKAFDDLYAAFTGFDQRLPDLVYEKKKLIMRVALASEVNVLARALDRLSEQHRRTRDFTANSLRNAMREIIACFPVYRTYTVCDGGSVLDRDRRFVESAVRDAKRRNPASEPGVFDFIRDVLLLRNTDDLTSEQRDERCRFVMKFQQLTGPTMAKGLEDTTFYIYNRLTSLNEVGGDPVTFGIDTAEFHKRISGRAAAWPHALLTSSTHDTKRSEDVRARINVLSEMPKAWRAGINRWARLNRRHKTKIDGTPAPSRNDEYLLYQTLIGTWPEGAVSPDASYVERLVDYLLKAIREAQVHTSWINPNEAYEEAIVGFVRAVLAGDDRRFFDDIARFVEPIARLGAINSLTMQALKLTAPGVPDLYQGTEWLDFSLVDPDNRRPVDFAARWNALDEVERGNLAAVATAQDWKLVLTARLLAYRAAEPELFTGGGYTPLAADGYRARHVLAFARTHGEKELVVVVPRLVAGLSPTGAAPLAGVWGDATIQLERAAQFRSLLSGDVVDAPGGRLPVAEATRTWPVALLERLPG